MHSPVYLFNPDYDMAMANFTPYYKAPAEILRMADNLSVLPVWFAGKGSGVKVDSLERVALFRRQLGEICPEGEGREVLSELLSSVDWTEQWPSARYVPWGWTPALLHRLRLEGVDEEFLPSAEEMQRIRYLSSRERCLEILPAFAGWEGICGEMKACKQLTEVDTFIRERGQVILKAPWSGSGRGLWKVSAASWNAQLAGWTSRILKVQGRLMAEPIYDKVADFAMEFFSDENGEVRFVGYSYFETDVHGNYKANRLLSNTAIEERLSRYVSLERLSCIGACLEASLKKLLGQAYQGYLGVDMMVCRVEDGYRIHPCVEINLRMNMGVLSRILYDRYVHPLSEGEYVVEHYLREGEALSFHREMVEKYPLEWKEGKVASGYLPLTPVREDTRFQAYLRVEVWA
ncbi:hypothetical protein [uncultured Bacteroides sp.]|uniref:hypothetical protein n=1 Tax=uncultured Bacteroides sp. TaxID=162156 RepID=UPI00262757B3|nr:hypothetical protein [uncultured Bacteroides sp.]